MTVAAQMQTASRRPRRYLPAIALLALAAPALAAAVPFRVCAEADNLPFSNARGAGFENKIAALLARDLRRPLRYVWSRQGEGFIRQTLGADACDAVIGVPAQVAGVATTQPYYRSAYVLVSRRDSRLSFADYADPRWHDLKIGLHAIGGDGANSPPAHALALHGLAGQVVGYTLWADDGRPSPQGDVIAAVADGDIDAAIVWGPIAGYFAKAYGRRLNIAPAPAEPALPYQPFAWDIAVAVRQSDQPLRQRLDASLRRHGGAIRRILRDYGIPLIPPEQTATQPPATAPAQ